MSEPSSLPLKGKRVSRLHIIVMAVLLSLLFLFNFFYILRNSKPVFQPKENATYDTTGLTPLNNSLKSDSPSLPPSFVSPVMDIKQQEREEQIKIAKAMNFIERLQASQGISSSNASNASSTSFDSTSQNDRAGVHAASKIQDPNTVFLMNASNSTAVHVYATHYGSLPFMIGQGKFIFGTLALALKSDLPGQMTAVVSQDVYGDQGRKILIPKGSSLIGEYKSGLNNNQSRLFVVWTRIREPNGIDIMLGSEGTDALGQAGLTGPVDYHFVARFGAASLVSMIGAGASTIGVSTNDQMNSASAFRENMTQSLSQLANGILSQSLNIPPTIPIHQGEKIVVFVNRDLDFSKVYR